MRRLATVVEHSSNAVLAVDLKLRVLWVNRGFTRTTGWEAAECIGRPINDLLWHPDGDPSARAALRQAAVRGESCRVELVNRRKDGSPMWMDIEIQPTTDEDGQLTGWVEIALDITHRKRIEAALQQARDEARQASEAKSQFVANMSHELRTPMNAVLGMLQLVQATPLSGQQQDYLDKAEVAAQGLLGVLNDILDFSKVEAGKMTLDPRPFELDTLLRELSVLFASSLGGKPVEFVYELHPGLPARLLADDLRLRQVLTNLGGNAVKFTERGEVVLAVRPVEASGPEVTLEFSVRDTGIGISADSMNRLFRDFGQAEASTTRRYGGTGLGLAISRRLVTLMGGTLQVESTPGKGSCFSFRLRMPAWPHVAKPAAALRVLQVDARPLTRQAHLSMMQSLGWEVRSVETGTQARAAMEAEPGTFDLLLVDGAADGEPALATASGLAALATTSGLAAWPQLLVTGTAETETALAGPHKRLYPQVSACLVRPLTPGVLARAVSQPRGTTSPGPAQAQAGVQPLAGLRLLVAEDNENNQIVARELLTAKGAEVVIACDGQEAVDRMRSDGRFDLILMDWQMPRMDGLQACAAIRSLGFDRIPIVAMTANAMDSDRQQCLAAGMDDHVAKPFSMRELVARLVQHTRGAGPRAGPTSPSLSTSTRLADRAETKDAMTSAHAAISGTIPSTEGPGISGPKSCPTSSPPLLDAPGALARLDGDRSLYEQLLPLFDAEVQRTVAEFARLRGEAGSGPALARLAHALKGTAATVGAMRLAEAAANVEAAARGGAVPARELADLDTCAAQTLSALECLDSLNPARLLPS